MSSQIKNLVGLLVVAALALLIYFALEQTQIPQAVTILVAVFAGVFVALVFLPDGFQQWLNKTFNRVPVIVLGSWLGMALTMGSMGIFMAKMQNDMSSMKGNIETMNSSMLVMKDSIQPMRGYMELMSSDMGKMRFDMHNMRDDIENIDNVILGIDQTLEQDIGPSVQAMAPAVNSMGYSMHRGVQSFSNPMDYMRNAFSPRP